MQANCDATQAAPSLSLSPPLHTHPYINLATIVQRTHLPIPVPIVYYSNYAPAFLPNTFIFIYYSTLPLSPELGWVDGTYKGGETSAEKRTTA